MAVVAETPDFDYLWLRHNQPDLYERLKQGHAIKDLKERQQNGNPSTFLEQ
jgi:hypothetical protein